MKIAHCFVHNATESEYLKEFGSVTGYGLDIKVSWNLDQFYEIDLLENPLKESYDFGLFHPMCQKWARGTKDRENHPNQIPRARELAKEFCDYYIIENVPKAPLENPVKLNGDMFDLPIKYERIFETNFSVFQPPFSGRIRYDKNIECRKITIANIKGYTAGYYDSESLGKNCIPKVYLQYLLSFCPIFDVENPLDNA